MAVSTLKMIGWREWLALPDFGIEGLKAKVDSGARTSALHATKIRYIVADDGRTYVSFLVTGHRLPEKSLRIRALLIEKRMVKSSLGHASLRPVVLTDIELGGQRWPIEITLINRDPMGFRMLLGRQALKRRFAINPSRSFIQSREMATRFGDSK
jgi:hypothetical protein